MNFVLLAAVLATISTPIIPDPALTPGVTLPVTLQTICVKGYTKTARNVSEATKRAVFREYKVDPKSSHFEIDHLISLELGGSNDIKNLWPQSYDTKPLNAHIKDALEDHLHSLVCSAKVPLAQAQHDISTDWEGAYLKYVGPLPVGN